MTHILRSDFYKLRKARYFWVCLAVTVILAVGSVFLLDFTYRLAGDQMRPRSPHSRKRWRKAASVSLWKAYP